MSSTVPSRENWLFFIRGLPICFLSEQVLARWNHHDAARLNQVTGLGVEYYNDILSYRDPLFWDEAWEKSSLGFRTLAGSLNKKELLYYQNIRIRNSAEDPWQLAYTSDRIEEPRRTLENSALELSYGPEQSHWRVGILGEGHTEKAFADLGMRLLYAPAEGSQLQLIGWSVDTFYTEKKLQREDHRTRNPWSWELTALQTWGPSTIRLHHEQDQPLIWYQLSKDQLYTFRRQSTDLRWTYAITSSEELFLQIDQEQERESLATLSDARSHSYQDLRHTVELGRRLKQGNDTFTYALWGLSNRTRLQNFQDNVAGEDVQTRQEVALLWNWSKPLGQGIHMQHWGLTVNQVHLDEEEPEQATEVKVAWGPDFVLGKTARMRLTTTWDLDQLARDFPYTQKPFHPWGGGQASFVMIF